MGTHDDLTPESWLIYAIKAYDRPTYIKSELKEDLKHLGYVRRLFRRYHQYGELRERLILNHLMIIYNIFGLPAATKLLFFHTRPEDHGMLKTFLSFLNYMPALIHGINGKTIRASELVDDATILDALGKIKNNDTP